MNWILDRLKERTSWDGVIMVAAGAAILILGPLSKLAAYGLLGYGAWTLWKKEK